MDTCFANVDITWQWNELLPKGATAETVCDSLLVRPTLRICNGKNGNIHPIPGNINEISINYVTLQCRMLYIFAFFFKFTYSTWSGLQRGKMKYTSFSHSYFCMLLIYLHAIWVTNSSVHLSTTAFKLQFQFNLLNPQWLLLAFVRAQQVMWSALLHKP
jgi:hypothetical protein